MESPGPFYDRYGPWGVVAGASEGLGAEFARQLASKGLDLILIARREALLAELAEELADTYGVEAVPLKADLSDPGLRAHLDAAVGTAEVGCLIYNAALSHIGPFLDTSAEDHLREIDVNCRGPLMLTHYFASKMVSRGKGGIVLMSSMGAMQGSSLIANYAATKAYNLILGEGLWDELRNQGVDVLACCAGATRTPNYEASEPRTMGAITVPVQEPAEVVREALHALGRRPSVITGGWNRMASFFMHRLLPRRVAVQFMGKNMRSIYGGEKD